MEGVRLSLYTQLWWAQSRQGIPVGPLGHPGSHSEVIRMPGLRHTARPLPWVPETLSGCHNNHRFHPHPFVWHGPAFVTSHNWGWGRGTLPQLG